MYTWWRNEWVERNVNGKVVYYVPRVVFTFLLSAAFCICTHKFSNPLFCRFGIIVVVVIFVPLYVHPHVPSILFSLHAHVLVLVRWKNFPLDIFQLCMGFSTLYWACRKYNQFYFVRAHSTALGSCYPLSPLLLPARATLKYLFDTRRKREQESGNFSIFWHFPKMKFRNAAFYGWVGDLSLKTK